MSKKKKKADTQSSQEFVAWEPPSETPSMPESFASAASFATDSVDEETAAEMNHLIEQQERINKALLIDDSAAAFAANAENDLVSASNILGSDVGLEMFEGQFTGRMAVRIFVEQKVPEEDLDDRFIVAEAAGDVTTDVIEVGQVNALGIDYKKRYTRPVPCGSSISLRRSTDGTGTLGCLVASPDNRLFVLSNNHVLGRSNAATQNEWIIQPGVKDRRQFSNQPIQNDVIAAFTQSIPIQFGGPINQVDAAIAQTYTDRVRPEHFAYRMSTSTLSPAAAQNRSVKKCGRTTGFTVGLVTGMNASVPVRYGNQIARFTGQLTIQGYNGIFSDEGDSGSLIVDAATNRPVGLLFAGGGGITYANPIDLVLQRLNVRLVNQF